MSLNQLFSRRPFGSDGAFKRPAMLVQTRYQLPLASGHGMQPLVLVGQVVKVAGDSFMWVDGADIGNPVLHPIAPADDDVTTYLDTVSNYFEVHQRRVLAVLEVASQWELDLSPTLVARAVELMRDDLDASPEHALQVTLDWSELILEINRLAAPEKPSPQLKSIQK